MPRRVGLQLAVRLDRVGPFKSTQLPFLGQATCLSFTQHSFLWASPAPN